MVHNIVPLSSVPRSLELMFLVRLFLIVLINQRLIKERVEFLSHIESEDQEVKADRILIKNFTMGKPNVLIKKLL